MSLKAVSYTHLILGTLKVASSIDSWLSSASFIRTAGVLTEAAIEGKVDHLLCLLYTSCPTAPRSTSS